MNSITLITAFFTVVALIAAIFHLWYLREVVLDRRAIVFSGQNGDLLRLASQFVHVEATRFLINIDVLAVGVGILLGVRSAGWLLVLVPVISAVSSLFNLRGRARL